jgi:formamidopyrimidine-DNA glycosylase
MIDHQEIAEIYTTTKSVLERAIRARGTSTSDFRDTDGVREALGITCRYTEEQDFLVQDVGIQYEG